MFLENWTFCSPVLDSLHCTRAYTASINNSTGTVLYGRGQLASIWLKTSRPPAISDLAILFIYDKESQERFARFLRMNHTFALSVSKKVISSNKICCFYHIFHCFPPFYAQERIAPVTLCSDPLFLRAKGAIRSCRSLKRATRTIHSW